MEPVKRITKPTTNGVQNRFCVIKICRNANGSTDSNELFFSPPSYMYKNGVIRQKWITAISQFQEIKLADQFHICSRHFDAADYIKNIGLLKLNAVPKYFLSPVDEKEAKTEKPLLTIVKEENLKYSESNQTEIQQLKDEIKNLQLINDRQRAEIRSLKLTSNNFKELYEQLANSAKVVLKRCDIRIEPTDRIEPIAQIEPTDRIEPNLLNRIDSKQIIHNKPRTFNRTKLKTSKDVDPKQLPNIIKGAVIVIAEDDDEPDNKSEPSELPSSQSSSGATIASSLDENPFMKPFKCGKCNESYSLACHLLEHMKKHYLTAKKEKNIKERMKVKQYSAKIKEKSANPKQTPTDTNKPVLHFECFLCKKMFSSKMRMRKHLKTHERGHHCTICDVACTELELSQHLCGEDNKHIKCEYCWQSFTTTTGIVQHLGTHETGKKFYRCTKCPRFFALNRLKELHEENHVVVENKFACKICSKGFRDQIRLRAHLKNFHTSEKSYLCDECGKSFRLQLHLNRHKMRHGNPSFSCTKCPRQFYTPTSLRNHLDSHNNSKFVCGLCNAELASRIGYMTHMDRHQLKKSERKFCCEVCPKKFYDAKCLANHRAIHFDGRDHKCDYCDKSYKHRGDLNKHLKTHLGDLLYECEVCAQRFRLPRELQMHSYEHYQPQKHQAEETGQPEYKPLGTA